MNNEKLIKLPKQVEELTSQMDNIMKEVTPKPKVPFYVDTFSTYTWNGCGTPKYMDSVDSHNKYPGGNYEVNISGVQGQNYVTKISGADLNDAGTTQYWACVVKYDDGSRESYLVRGVDVATNKILIYPNLKKNIVNGKLSSIQDLKLGQHMTIEGYKGLVDTLYNMPLEHSIRDSFIDQHRGDTQTDTKKWTRSGFTSGTMTNGHFMSTSFGTSGNICSNSGNYYFANDTKRLWVGQQRSSSSDVRYLSYECELNMQTGYLETFIGLECGSVLVEFLLDDTVQNSVIVDGSVQRLCFDFAKAQKGKIKIILNTLEPTEINIGTTTWWLNDEFSGKLIKPHQKVVYMCDSWGMFHDEVAPKYLKELMSKDLGRDANVINHSKGGMTTNWALDWFDEYVAKENPDVVVFGFFTNDFTGSDLEYDKPDGTKGRTKLDTSTRTLLEQWKYQYQLLAEKSIKLGIQPILYLPASTGAIAQSQTHANAGANLEYGYNVTNLNPIFETVKAKTIVSNTINGNGENIDIKLVPTSTNSGGRKGVIVDTNGFEATGGNLQTWQNNGVDKCKIYSDGSVRTSYIKLEQVTKSAQAGQSYTVGNLYLTKTDNGDMQLNIVIQKADGTYVNKKVQLID